MFEKIIIIGAGPAGSSLAIQLKRLGLNFMLVDKTGEAGGLIKNAWSVENYLGFPPTTGLNFTNKIRSHLEKLDIKVHKYEVKKISKDKELFDIETDSIVLNSKIVVLAVGTKPIQNKEFDEFVYYDLFKLISCDNFYNISKVIIIGAGEAAFDYALSLSKLNKKVLICSKSENIKAKGVLRKTVENDINISILRNMTYDKILKIMDSKTSVLSAIGRESEVSSIGISGNKDNMFVIGDAKRGTLGQIGIAVGDGLKLSKVLEQI